MIVGWFSKGIEGLPEGLFVVLIATILYVIYTFQFVRWFPGLFVKLQLVSWSKDIKPLLWRKLGVSPLFEELIFRLGFLFVPIQIFSNSAPLPIFTAVVWSSVIFGYMHGGFKKVPLQGVSGLILSVVFLKCGGWNGDFFIATCVSVTAHSLINGGIYLWALREGYIMH